MDTGVAMAMMPTKSYAQARADKNTDLQASLALSDIYQKKLADKQAFEGKVNAQFAALKSLGIEQPDQDRINFFVNDLRSALSKKILDKYDGDVQKYMQYEGENDLQQYTSEILNSPILQQGLKNKYNFGMYSADVKDGKDFQRLVSYKLNDGTVKTDVPFAEALNDYYNYKTPELPYDGGFKTPGGAEDHFLANFHPDPNKRYGMQMKDENGNIITSAPPVTAQEYFTFLTENKENPLSPKDAYQVLNQKYPLIAGSLKWKTDNAQEMDLKLKQFGLSMAQFKDNSARGWAGINVQKAGLELKRQTLALAKAQSTGANADYIWRNSGFETSKNSAYAVGPGLGLVPNALSVIGIIAENDKSGKQVITGKATKIYSTTNPKVTADISGVDHKINEVDMANKYKDGDGNIFVKAKVQMTDDAAEKSGILKDGILFDKNIGFNSTLTGGKLNKLFGTNRKRTFDVFLPIPKDASSNFMFNFTAKDPTKLDNENFGVQTQMQLQDEEDFMLNSDQ